MRVSTRRAFGAVELIVVLAILLLLLGILMSGVQKARDAARRIESINNLKQLGIALHTYHDANNQFPVGNDKDNHSVYVALLPYVELANLQFTADKVPAVKVFVDPRDIPQANKDVAGGNYLFCAGAEPGLAKNNGIFCPDKAVTLAQITNGNGSSNTLAIGTTLRGDGGKKAVDVKRQHVALKKGDLKGIKESAGVQDWKDDKNIAGDRCTNWTDGRFLQGTFTATRGIDDEAPDVNCEGQGGLSALRSLDGAVPILYADGHAVTLSREVPLMTLKLMANWQNAQPFTAP